MDKNQLNKILSQTKDLENLFSENEVNDDLELEALMNEYGIDLNELEKVFTEDVPKVQMKIKLIHGDAVLPKFAYDTDSGVDLYSVDEHIIPPMGRQLIPTGIVIDVPENHEIQIRSKSGLALNQGLFVLNSPGTVDQGYTGEIKVILFNTNNEEFKITKGMKVAQAVLCPVVCGKWIDIVKVSEVENKDRSNNGFGSTGLV
jgi:dUTP pyrophosphatase